MLPPFQIYTLKYTQDYVEKHVTKKVCHLLGVILVITQRNALSESERIFAISIAVWSQCPPKDGTLLIFYELLLYVAGSSRN